MDLDLMIQSFKATQDSYSAWDKFVELNISKYGEDALDSVTMDSFQDRYFDCWDAINAWIKTP